ESSLRDRRGEPLLGAAGDAIDRGAECGAHARAESRAAMRDRRETGASVDDTALVQTPRELLFVVREEELPQARRRPNRAQADASDPGADRGQGDGGAKQAGGSRGRNRELRPGCREEHDEPPDLVDALPVPPQEVPSVGGLAASECLLDEGPPLFERDQRDER